MNLHEYQSKSVFARYGIDVPRGIVAENGAAAKAAAEELGGPVWVVKAQAHTGARGKAGGVKLAKTLDEVVAFTDEMVGSILVTHQTGPQGLPVNMVLIEEGLDIQNELYLSVLVDRATKKVVFIASSEGGMDIEEVAEKQPEKMHSVGVDIATGLQGFHSRAVGFAMGLNKDEVKLLHKTMKGLFDMFVEQDAALVEINPLILTGDNRMLALDAKVNLDSNALYRHADLAEMRDATQEDERENIAHEHELNYVALDGNIGCMVNGAGLAMATMDIIKLHGGEPANFLDVGGGATAERVTEAFKLITSSDDVKAILVNIFGGIVRCDLIAEGIIKAVEQVGLNIPVVVRLQGTNAAEGGEMLEKSGLNIIAKNDLTEAAETVVSQVA